MKISLKAIIIGSVISSSLVFSSVALAATYKDITEPTTIQIEDSQIIQVLPEGGSFIILMGHLIIMRRWFNTITVS